MSDINDLIHANSKIAYEQGRKEERTNLLKLARQCCWEDEIGEGIYLKDLLEYIEEDDNERTIKF